MSTLPRNIFPNNLYHVFNRATERRTIFYTEKDYNRFLEKIFFYKDLTGVEILSYVILPNHFHFLLKEPEKKSPTLRVIDPEGRLSAISNFMSLLINSYTKYFNSNKEHSGRLFQGPFKSKLIDDDKYLQVIIAYINLNPVKHGIVKNINDWQYSSHCELMEQINRNIINNNNYFDILDYKQIIKDNIDKIKKIRLEFD